MSFIRKIESLNSTAPVYICSVIRLFKRHARGRCCGVNVSILLHAGSTEQRKRKPGEIAPHHRCPPCTLAPSKALWLASGFERIPDRQAFDALAFRGRPVGCRNAAQG